MKSKHFFPFFLLLAFAIHPNNVGAQDASRIFNEDITWLGVDYSKVTVLGETASPIQIIDYFDKINTLIISESEKYNFRLALNKMEVPYDLGPVTKANAGINPDELVSMSSKSAALTKEDVEAAVRNYDLKGQKGIGLVFVMEALDKPGGNGHMWVTFLDMATKKVLLTERMSGKPGGFGFRNYWARPIYNVLQDIQKTRYEQWKRKYKD
ncbi:MAG: hypothetical protein H6577_02775 [Lewinellaceae bacterium]|nr:hypothetical protein [Saprospiraceae bacterium]MCB9337034.1 hypothetical protein [Lewinellaceae bacterium]